MYTLMYRCTYMPIRQTFILPLTHLVHSAEGLGDRTPLCQGMETKIETDGVHLNLQRGIGSIGGITLINSES